MRSVVRVHSCPLIVWSVGQGVKTPPFHGGNTGSNPVRTMVYRRVEKSKKSFKKVLTKGVIECIIIKSSVERAKEHGKRSVRVEKKLKTFSKNF